jgi:hypothetical protein
MAGQSGDGPLQRRKSLLRVGDAALRCLYVDHDVGLRA